ncbi:uncharacterized protein [Procambarus clarkii]|uniref:uncharacterized protein n=1 Tax=Procambarus clarkii TaxID=6728 RepID=UPI001E674E81|nr:uncharacterized protein LOC123746440 [Procambarus clarkii]
MAVTGSKKSSAFSIHSLKKAIKKFVKKTLPTKGGKKVKEDKTVQRVDFEAEIEDNLANEALEARLIQIIEASPATLDLNISLKGSLMVKTSPDFDVQFGTFWTSDDDDASWALCKDLLQTSKALGSTPAKA